MTGGSMSSYEAGTAFMQVTASFSGVEEQLTAEFTKLGDEAGQVFSDIFDEAVKKGTEGLQIASDSILAKQGEERATAFADAFKAKIDEALRNLNNVSLGLDDTAAEAKIAEVRASLEELG